MERAESDTSESGSEGGRLVDQPVVASKSLHIDDGDVDFDSDFNDDMADIPAPKPFSDRGIADLTCVPEP